MLLGKGKLNAIEILVSKALIDSYIIDYEFVSVNMFSHSHQKYCKQKLNC